MRKERRATGEVLRVDDLAAGFKALGVECGKSVLVHSSLRSFGYVEGGAQTVIQALRETVGPDGTVMVPTLTGKATDSKETPPVFDVHLTPCWTGTIPETLRAIPSAKRSLHPTHSVSAVGGQRDALVAGHETSASPCDDRSPYYRNCIWGGSILLIGVDQESNTTVHCCEEIAGVPYHLRPDVVEIPLTGYDGETVMVRNRLHDWHKPPTDFNKLEPMFEERKVMRKLRIGNALVRRLDAGAMLEVTVDILTRNPHFLLKRSTGAELG